jgi:lauroyl/myristoyl acyltransferase
MARDPQELARQFFDRQLMLMTASYALSGCSDDRFKVLCDFEGLENVRELVKQGSGVLVVTFHFGTHLLSITKLNQEGFPVATIRPYFMRNISSKGMRQLLFLDENTIYVGTSRGLGTPIREIVRKLKEGYIVGIAPDGDQGGGLEFKPFLGGEYPLRRGFMEVARLAKVPMVYAQGMARGNKLFVRSSEPWFFSPEKPPHEVAEEFLTFALREFETYVREYPESIWWTKPMEVALGLRPKPSEKDGKTEGDSATMEERENIAN